MFIEEKLFDRRRDLFTDLSAVFMSTDQPVVLRARAARRWVSIATRRTFGPIFKQMILGLVVDGIGLAHLHGEMSPGNTADVTVLLPVIDRLRQRYGLAASVSWPTGV